MKVNVRSVYLGLWTKEVSIKRKLQCVIANVSVKYDIDWSDII